MQLLDRPTGTLPGGRDLSDRPAHACSVGPPYLSARQLVIAAMIVDGSATRDIALELSLPLRAVEGHLHGVLRTLDLTHPEDLTRGVIEAHRAPPPCHQVAGPRSEGVTALLLELAITRGKLERQRLIGEHLQRALVSRDGIGQAKGILMERYKIGADAAFAMLERESSRSNRKLVEVVRCLLYSGEMGSVRTEER